MKKTTLSYSINPETEGAESITITAKENIFYAIKLNDCRLLAKTSYKSSKLP